MIWVSFLFALYSCGGGNTLDIKGDVEARQLAQNMIQEMGGKKKWETLKSIYLRTVSIDMTTGKAFAIEEWINLDAPKFMNHRIVNDQHNFQIVDGNDGWMVVGRDVSMMMPDRVTGYLQYYDNFFMRNIKILVEGGEGIEVKINKDNSFDVFKNNAFIAGFGLDENALPVKYITPNGNQGFNIMNITEWGEYKGYKYPLTVKGENIRANYQTDYWDAGTMDAESSFDITFDPYQIAKNIQ